MPSLRWIRGHKQATLYGVLLIIALALVAVVLFSGADNENAQQLHHNTFVTEKELLADTAGALESLEMNMESGSGYESLLDTARTAAAAFEEKLEADAKIAHNLQELQPDSRYYSAFPQALSTLSRVLSQGGGNAVGMREKLPRLIAVLEKMDKVYTLGGKTSVESLNQFYRDWAPLYDELDAILRE